jgi:small GTP-binding protein
MKTLSHAEPVSDVTGHENTQTEQPPIDRPIPRSAPPQFSYVYIIMLLNGDGTATIQARVVVIGDSTVGKTSILNRLTTNNFNKIEAPTIVSNFQIYRRDVYGTCVELQIWDTAGQEKFRSLAPIYYRNAAAAILVYDISSRATFDHLQQWVDAFREITPARAVVVVAGNKQDLGDAKVLFPEAQEWARERGFLVREVSALSGAGVRELFDDVVDGVIAAREAERTPLKAEPAAASGGGCPC